MTLEIGIINFVLWIFFLVILFAIIRAGVREGIIEAHKRINGIDDEKAKIPKIIDGRTCPDCNTEHHKECKICPYCGHLYKWKVE
ncbi:MAG: hypothetical protein FWB98_08225 [Defluviitaleaceae bacterium]|nr:hypothetical protein [Defluviitaleaceae bacterium]